MNRRFSDLHGRLKPLAALLPGRESVSLGAFWRDLRYALRGFAVHPGLTFAAAASIAIGIGANTAIFSVANALLLRPLPYLDAERLAILWNR